MTHDEFIGEGQHRAPLGSRCDAERVTWPTLETLAERIREGAAENLTRSCRPRSGSTSAAPHPGPARQRAGTSDLPEAAYHVSVVVEVLGEASTGGLSTRSDRLFEAGIEGRMPPRG